MIKVRLKEVVFTVVTWVFLLWGINFICGLIVQNRYIALDPVSPASEDRTFGYYEPNQDKLIMFPGMETYHVRVNNLGLRTTGEDLDITIDEIADQYRILALGDSFTFGLYVNDEESYPYQLQEMIRESGKDAVVLNAGIGSTSISDHLYYLKKKGMSLKPDLVVINFCTNDLDENLKEVKQLDRIKSDAVFNLGREFKLAKFMRVFRKAQLEYKYDRFLKKTKDERLKEILKNRSTDLDDIFYAAKKEAGLTSTNPASPELDRFWNPYLRDLDQTISYLKEQNADILFYIVPEVLAVHDQVESRYEDILIPFLEERGVPYLDISSVIRNKEGDKLSYFNSPPRDYHLSGEGNHLVAKEIFTRIRDQI